jgi:iron complex transport system ATP-binding protein
VIRCQGLEYSYKNEPVIRDLSFALGHGETCFLVGPNGSGKTTLLKCLNGILEPQGSVYIDGEEIKNLTRKEIAKMIGYLPQRSELSSLTVFDSILLGRRPT